jgi:hypothetical protein
MRTPVPASYSGCADDPDLRALHGYRAPTRRITAKVLPGPTTLDPVGGIPCMRVRREQRGKQKFGAY